MTAVPEEPANMAEAIAQAQATLATMGVDVSSLGLPDSGIGQVAALATQSVAIPKPEPIAPTNGNDFSSGKSKKPVDFTMDGDTFLARPRIGGGVVLGLAKVAGLDDIHDHIELIRGFLKRVLLPGSYTLFMARLDGVDWVNPETNAVVEGLDLEPIELSQVLGVFKFLIKQYTNGEEAEEAGAGFPTPGSSASAGGSPNAGPSSLGLVPSTPVSTSGLPT